MDTSCKSADTQGIQSRKNCPTVNKNTIKYGKNRTIFYGVFKCKK